MRTVPPFDSRSLKWESSRVDRMSRAGSTASPEPTAGSAAALRATSVLVAAATVGPVTAATATGATLDAG
jgi:hypothetical protein